ncbi:MAG: IPT/TIG domain-containing protein [Planctomycetota bacterium]
MTIFTRGLAALLLVAAVGVGQSNVSYIDFSSTIGLTLNGNAAQNPGGLTLDLVSASGQSSSVFSDTPLSVAAGFDMTFTFQVLPLPGGGQLADGFAFVLHNDPNGSAYLGTGGGSMGYAPGILNAVVIEFDNYVNGAQGDTSDNELSIHTSGPAATNNNETNSIGRVTPTVDFDDGGIHVCRLEYTPGILNVYLDVLTTPVLTVPYDFTTGGTFLTGGAVAPPALNDFGLYAGFTGGTGALGQNIQIYDWLWTSPGGQPACFDSKVGLSNPGGPFDVLTINGSAGGFYRTVTIDTYTPWSIQLAQPPTNPSAAKMAIIATFGVPNQSTAYSTPWGDLCFAPYFVVPAPYFFTLVDSLVLSPALLPPFMTPFNFAIPGIDIPITVTFQGAVIEDNADPNSVGITNAVVLEIKALDPPVITSILPQAPAVGGTVTITGTGFHPNMLLDVGGTLTPVTVTSSTTATFVATQVYPCDTQVTIANPDQQFAIGAINTSPTILAFPFFQGPAAGGGPFVVSGTNLGMGSTVDFGGTPAQVNSASASVITGVIPAGTPMSSVVVTITNAGGCQVTTNYTYN